MSLAWHIEAFRRSGKKFPSLDKALGRKTGAIPSKQSNEELLAAMRTWVAITEEKAAKP